MNIPLRLNQRFSLNLMEGKGWEVEANEVVGNSSGSNNSSNVCSVMHSLLHSIQPFLPETLCSKKCRERIYVKQKWGFHTEMTRLDYELFTVLIIIGSAQQNGGPYLNYPELWRKYNKSKIWGKTEQKDHNQVPTIFLFLYSFQICWILRQNVILFFLFRNWNFSSFFFFNTRGQRRRRDDQRARVQQGEGGMKKKQLHFSVCSSCVQSDARRCCSINAPNIWPIFLTSSKKQR